MQALKGKSIGGSKNKPPLLDDKNYANWSFRMMRLLHSGRLWKIVNEVKNETVPDDWDDKDMDAQHIIINEVGEDQVGHIRDLETARAMWLKLKSVHEQTSFTSWLYLIMEFHATKWRSGTLENFFADIRDQASTLNIAGRKVDELLQIAVLLGGLPPCYKQVISNLQSLDKDTLTLDLVQGRIKDERRILQANGEDADPAEEATATKAGRPWRKTKVGKQSGSGSVIRDSSSGSGTCFGDNTVTDYSLSGPCFHCKVKGHRKRNCPLWKKTKAEGGTGQQKSSANKADNRLFKADASASKAIAYNDWIIDSGASSHMTSDRTFFSKLYAAEGGVWIADDRKLKTVGVGCGRLLDNGESTLTLADTLYVPALGGGLLSVSKMDAAGMKIVFQHGKCTVEDDTGELVISGTVKSGLYQLDRPIQIHDSAHLARRRASMNVWHRRLGHRNGSDIRRLCRDGLVLGVELDGTDSDQDCSNCECCIKSKLTRLPFPRSKSRAVQPLDLVHTDLAGPMEQTTIGGRKYLMTLIDDFSRFTIVVLLKEKSEAVQVVRDYVAQCKTQFGRTVKIIRTDNGTEYCNAEMNQLLKNEGIKHQMTVVHTPEQNGVAERKNRTLQEMALTMLSDAGMHKKYWGEAVLTAAYTQNRLTSRSIDTTPYQKWYGKKPSLGHMRIFGSKCWTHVPKAMRRKWDDKAKPGILLGYGDTVKGYRVLDANGKTIRFSRSIAILESSYPASSSTFVEVHEPAAQTMTIPTSLKKKGIVDKKDSEDVSSNYSSDGEWLPSSVTTGTPIVTSVTAPTAVITPEGPYKGKRMRGRPRKLVLQPREDEVDPIEIAPIGQTPLLDDEDRHRKSTRSTKGKAPDRYGYVAGLDRDPETIQQVRQLPEPEKKKWLAAVDNELESLQAHNVWTLVDMPVGRKAISCKWVLRRKRDAAGKMDTYKARLVARGFSQRYGLDYEDTFAPVVRHETVRVLLAVAAARKLHVRHLDVCSAYLNGELREEIYMQQPPGYEVRGKETQVCRLHKSIYGLKQAARSWNNMATQKLHSIGFQQAEADQCLFTRQYKGISVYVLLYVDDLLVVGETESVTQRVGAELNQHFDTKDLGSVSSYLGIRVQQEGDGSFLLDQEAKIVQLLVEHNMHESKPALTPMETCFLSSNDDSPDLPDNSAYRQAVGSLLYLATASRPDIASAIGILCRRVQKPTQRDWNGVKRVLRYLKFTKSSQLRLTSEEVNLQLRCYTDADWAGDHLDRRSTSGYAFQLGCSTVSWSSKKQNIVALSSTEAEYVAASSACQELLWLRQLQKDLNILKPGPTVVFEDNQGCIKMIDSDKTTRRTKHIDVRHHFLRDLRDNDVIKVVYCPSNEMVADSFTKPLPKDSFNLLKRRLGLTD